jgi:hypothetical protein
MSKIRLIVFCLLLSITAMELKAEHPAGNFSKKRNFDWKKIEKEHKEMREKIHAEHKKHIEELKNFHQRYAAEKDPAKKEIIRTELKKFLSADFNKKLEYSKKRIKNMKNFVARLEEQQRKAETKSAEIIDKRTNEVLNGKIIPQRRPQIKK